MTLSHVQGNETIPRNDAAPPPAGATAFRRHLNDAFLYMGTPARAPEDFRPPAAAPLPAVQAFAAPAVGYRPHYPISIHHGGLSAQAKSFSLSGASAVGQAAGVTQGSPILGVARWDSVSCYGSHGMASSSAPSADAPTEVRIINVLVFLLSPCFQL